MHTNLLFIEVMKIPSSFFGFMASLFFLLACNKDEITIDNDWANTYSWLGTIMQKAENGEYKDLGGKPAMVYITVLYSPAEPAYFGISYGTTGLLYDELRNSQGEVISKGITELTRIGMIYPFNPENITVEEFNKLLKE